MIRSASVNAVVVASRRVDSPLACSGALASRHMNRALQVGPRGLNRANPAGCMTMASPYADPVRHLHLSTAIAAPPEIVFDACLQVDVHTASMTASGERAVGGVTSGRLRLGDEVTWQGRHLGRSWRMTARITAYTRPRYFADEQVAGPFAAWRHAHYFEAQADGTTLMRDVIDFMAPYGRLGRLAEFLVLDRYLTRLITARNQHLAMICQADQSV